MTMSCPRCKSPTPEETLNEFGGVCPKCLLQFAEEKDAPAFPSLEIVEMVGQGGMGVVYKAVQKSLGRTVALKVLSPQLSSDPEFVERFTREARALAQLSHPNIVAIYDSGIHDKVPYLVMEFVEGNSLRQLLSSKELTAPQALEIVPQICDALYYAHAKGVVHRDIKPENILLDAAGRVKIADYGLAKIASLDQPRITKSNVAMGTPHYMAPEQIEKTSEVDHRADIYSLGVVIYEMLTGELPLGRFKAPSERAEIDRRLDRVVLKSLEKEPADRYQSANEVKAQFTRPPDEPASAGKVDRLSLLLYLAVAVLMGISGTMFAIQQPGSGVTFLFMTLMILIPAVFRSVSLHYLQGRPRPEPGAPPPRTSRLAVASGILCLHGVAALTVAIILMVVDHVIAANVFAALAGALLFASIGFAVPAVILILGSRGALRGLWIPITSGFCSGLILIVGILGFMVRSASPAPPTVSMESAPSMPPRAPTPIVRPKGPGFRMTDAWPRPEDLPSDLKFDVVKEGKAALEPDSFNGKPAADMLPDLRLVRRVEIDGGAVTLLGFEFVTEEARARWQEVFPFYTPVAYPDRSIPAGRSFFHLETNAQKNRDWVSASEKIQKQLRPILQQKMKESREH